MMLMNMTLFNLLSGAGNIDIASGKTLQPPEIQMIK